MSYPTKYKRQYDYVSYQNANPARPLPAGQIHADYNAIASSLAETIDFLKKSIRSDGAVMNGAIGSDQLTDAVKASLGDVTVVQEILDQIAVVDDAAAAASTSATNAASSASAAATSATNAANSATEAQSFSGIPQVIKSAAYTTVLGDAQKHILHPTSDNNPRTFTIDSNANVSYPIGTAITFINEINTVTIAITSDTLVQAGSGLTGSRTLAANGVATAVKITSTKWMISGAGLT